MRLYHQYVMIYIVFFFFFNDTATTEIYTLSLHDALPILRFRAVAGQRRLSRCVDRCVDRCGTRPDNPGVRPTRRTFPQSTTIRRHAMARTAIQPVDMADPRPRYTHGWRVGNTVYVAGQLALDKDGKLVGPNDIGAQTRRVLENMRRVVETGGASLRDVVKITVFVTDIRYREGYGEVRQEFFGATPPASTLVQVAGLAIPGALIEIEAVAVID